MWNLLDRATVGDDLAIEIDGERQAWWDEEIAAHRERLKQWDEDWAKQQEFNQAVHAAIEADPSRSNEEIAAEMGCHPKAVEFRRPLRERSTA
jgi:hypothetical protein